MRTESPTSLKVFQQCPRKYQAQYVTKELPWVQSAAAARGDKIHKLMEFACGGMWESIDWPAAEMQIRSTAYKNIIAIERLKDVGWKVEVELQTATDGLGNKTGWWDENSWMRSKIDICATHPCMDYAIIIDWKTGKIYGEDRIQLDINAMCLKPITGLDKYLVMFAYLDQDVVKDYNVVVDLNQPKLFDRVTNRESKLLDTMLVIDSLKESYVKDFWPEKKNKFCSWCGVSICPNKR